MTSNPFAVLGIAPTLEIAEVKKGYFAALARHPPQRDAEGFQRVRAAYEALLRPGGLRLAFMQAPLDIPAEQARCAARLQAQSAPESSASPTADDRFLERFFGVDLATTIAHFTR